MYRRPLNSLWNRSASGQPLRNRLGFEVLEARQMLAATLWVDPNVTPTATIFSTISNAVIAAHSGDTIKVVAGTYREIVDVTKTLTIVGGQVRVSGEPTGPSIVTNVGLHQQEGSFLLDANSITIKNFTLEGDTSGIIASANFTGYNILNNTFLDDSTGLNLNTSLSSSAKTSTVNGNTFFYDNSGLQPTDGILTDVGARNVTISNNTFFADDTDAAIKIDGTSQSSNVQILNNRIVFDNGFVIANATKSKIDDNTIIGFSNTAIELAGGITGSEVVGNNLAFAATSPPSAIVLNTALDSTSDTNNKISGNTIRGFYFGIELVAADHNTVSGNTVLDSVSDGIQLTDSSSTFNTISSNSVAHSGENGIGIYLTSDSNTVSQNTANNNGDYGIQVASNDNTVSKNTFNGNTKSGAFLDASTGNSLTGNTMSDNGDAGIVMVDASTNTLSSNTASFNATNGVAMESGSNSNKVMNNTVNHNGDSGIVLLASTMNTLSGNVVNFNTNSGFELEDVSDQNKLTDNTANSNTNGYFIDSSSNNMFSANMSLANANFGFEVFGGSIQDTFSGNNASGNFEAGFIVDGSGGSSDTFTKNTANSNLDNGFDIQGDSSMVSGNTAKNNRLMGFDLVFGNGDSISDNTATGNGKEGIVLETITNSTVSGNTAKNNVADGIDVESGSSGNTISGNTASGNGQALGGFDLFDGSGTTTNNTWTNNTAGTRSPAGLG